MSGIPECQTSEAMVLAIAGAPRRRYNSPSDLAWDRSLDPERQIRSLEKWLTIERTRYIHDRDTASLLRLREVRGMLNLIKRIRGA